MTNPKDVNRGVLFQNDRKEIGSNQPDRRGTANVDGIWYWVASWNPNQSNPKSPATLAFTVMTQEEADKHVAKQAERQRPQEGQQQPRQQPQQRPEQAQQQTPAAQTPPAGHPASEPPMDFDDDIPF